MKRTRRKSKLNTYRERKPILKIPVGARDKAINEIHETIAGLSACGADHGCEFEVMEAWLTDVFENALDEASAIELTDGQWKQREARKKGHSL